jgi:hypothetical protein
MFDVTGFDFTRFPLCVSTLFSENATVHRFTTEVCSQCTVCHDFGGNTVNVNFAASLSRFLAAPLTNPPAKYRSFKSDELGKQQRQNPRGTTRET